MNYYPYIPVMPTRPSLFGIFKGFNFGSILSGTPEFDTCKLKIVIQVL